ncbi:MAG: hypothetical protein V1827_04210 [Candidatus Micrarchaeota archaeon]
MKGQYFSFDAIIAAVIFVLALVALLSYWHSVRSFLDYQNDPLSKDAVRISNNLFMPASPPNDCGNMASLGLAVGWNDRRVNASVLDCAKNRDQAWLQERLGTPYGVSIIVTNVADGSLISEIGEAAPGEASNVVNIRRLATVVDETGASALAKVDLTLYQ